MQCRSAKHKCALEGAPSNVLCRWQKAQSADTSGHSLGSWPHWQLQREQCMLEMQSLPCWCQHRHCTWPANIHVVAPGAQGQQQLPSTVHRPSGLPASHKHASIWSVCYKCEPSDCLCCAGVCLSQPDHCVRPAAPLIMMNHSQMLTVFRPVKWCAGAQQANTRRQAV